MTVIQRQMNHRQPPSRTMLNGLLVWALTWAHANALAAPAAPAAFEAVREHPRWTSFVQQVVSRYVVPVPEYLLRRGCESALAAGPAEEAVEPVVTCINGALAELDGISAYIDPATQARDTANAARPFVGIGLEFARKIRGDPMLVVQPITGGPGDRAGIRPGDQVLEIDGADLRPLSTEEAIAAMRGDAGSVARVTLRRTGHAEPIVLTARREQIRILTARAKLLPGGLAYVRINQFARHTAQQPAERLEALHTAGSAAPTGLVLDLRNNSGGLLDGLVDVASLLAPPGQPVVGTWSRDKIEMRRTGPAQGEAAASAAGVAPTRDWPTRARIVVLVNDRTASGAEALAQFLRETRGARLAGQQTFGAPHIQQRLRIDGGATVQLVIAIMESPLGQRWPRGLTPDTRLEPEASPPPEFGHPDDAWLGRAVKLLLADDGRVP